MPGRGDRRQHRGAEEKDFGIECSKKEKAKQFLIFDPWGFTQFRKAIKQPLEQKAARQSPFLVSNTGFLNKISAVSNVLSPRDSRVRGTGMKLVDILNLPSLWVFSPYDEQGNAQ